MLQRDMVHCFVICTIERRELQQNNVLGRSIKWCHIDIKIKDAYSEKFAM